MSFPYPHIRLSDVTQITPDLLRQNGIRGLLLDIDGTLMQTRDSMPASPVLDWMRRMKENGILLYILSNNKHHGRVKAFAESQSLPWQYLARKPRRKGFRQAFRETGIAPGQLAVVGDQIFTDMWGARRNGCLGILVESTDRYLWYFPFRRLAELPFRKERK